MLNPVSEKIFTPTLDKEPKQKEPDSHVNMESDSFHFIQALRARLAYFRDYLYNSTNLSKCS